MKTLSDGTNVSARSYYFLLDWNELNNKQFIFVQFGKERLCDLTRPEYKTLFKHATTTELINL
jgi:hypothetical protein